ncbi:MAG: ribonuclease P protein component [Actinobacteria bacterium]|nr:ribonuclease P protein component [Actinomycetota bacterium]
MSRTQSLRHRRDFDRVVARGARAAAGPVQVFAAASEVTRLGLAVGVRDAGAVVRNRVRRRLRAAFERCSIARPMDVVVRADDRVARMDFQELVSLLCGSLERAERQVVR